MTRAAALLLVASAVALVRLRAPAITGASAVVLAFGFSLIAAYLLGGAADRLRLPRMSGYLVFGLLCGPYVLNLISARMASELQVVNGIALALIAVVAGLEMNLPALRRQLRPVLSVGAVTMAGTVVVMTLLLWIAWPVLPLPQIADPVARAAVALVAAALIASFSPTVSIAVIAEARARGPLTDLVMASVILADLLLIVVFALAMQLVRWTAGTTGHGVSVGVELAWQMGGSLAFGAIAGAVFAFCIRVVRRELTLALLGLCALLAFVAPRFDFELILAALAAGLVVENIAPPEGDALRTAVERGALPVLVVFFAAAGASVQLDALAALGLVAVATAAVRLGCIRGLAQLGIRLGRVSLPEARLAWMGLVSQAGVTLGLATVVAEEFPEWGRPLRALIVALTALHVLVGPILFRAALRRAGEVETL